MHRTVAPIVAVLVYMAYGDDGREFQPMEHLQKDLFAVLQKSPEGLVKNLTSGTHGELKKTDGWAKAKKRLNPTQSVEAKQPQFYNPIAARRGLTETRRGLAAKRGPEVSALETEESVTATVWREGTVGVVETDATRGTKQGGLPYVTITCFSILGAIGSGVFYYWWYYLRVPHQSPTERSNESEGLQLQILEKLSPAEESKRRGIDLEWFLHEYPKIIHDRMGDVSPNFVEMAPVVAHGEHGLGKGKVCPRDDRQDCSIVDAIFEKGSSGRATVFLSWVWGYKLSEALSALRQWTENLEAKVEQRHFIWWCFFCNNQYRILCDGEQVSTDELADVFGRSLLSVGNLLVLMDSFNNPRYITRVWCIFELYVATEKAIPFNIIAPESAHNELEAMAESGSGMKDLRQCLRVDVAEAKASKSEDEEGIKSLIIRNQGSFDVVNSAVKKALLEEILKDMRAILTKEDEPPMYTPTYR